MWYAIIIVSIQPAYAHVFVFVPRLLPFFPVIVSFKPTTHQWPLSIPKHYYHHLPSSSVQTTLDPAQATDVGETDSPPVTDKDESLRRRGCPHASATRVRRGADNTSTRRVVRTASIGTDVAGALLLLPSACRDCG